MDNAYEWYTSGPRQRLQPGGAIVVVMTRWSTKDLTGKLLNAQTNENADQWELVEFPAVLNDEPLWPEFWKLDELKVSKHLCQNKNGKHNGNKHLHLKKDQLLKRDGGKYGQKKTYLNYSCIQSYDTAFSKKDSRL